MDRSIAVTNCVLHAAGHGSFLYAEVNDGVISADYNVYIREQGAALYLGADTVASSVTNALASIQASNGRELHSIEMAADDALFADPASWDFHPKSEAGRWTAAGWTTDDATSPLVDLGSPASPYANEPDDNGGRINAGAYGNTQHASLSGADRRLTALTFNNGGRASGTTALRWAHANCDGDDTVRLEFSPDMGASWSNIAEGVLAVDGVYSWDASGFASSSGAKWRLTSEDDESVSDAGDYNNYQVTIGPSHRGIILQGHPTPAGTVIDRGGGASVHFPVRYEEHVADTSLRDMTLLQGYNGLMINRYCTGNSFIRLVLRNAANIGLNNYRAGDTVLRNVLIAGSFNDSALDVNPSGGEVIVENCTLWSLSSHVIDTGNRLLRCTNCVFRADGAGKYIFDDGVDNLDGDYNIFALSNGAAISAACADLEAWQTAYPARDAHSFETDPLLLNPPLDCHPLARAGRWDPDSDGWVLDAVDSPCIDAGDPTMPFANETLPNGRRINIGVYGNTIEASRSVVPPPACTLLMLH